MAVWGQCIGSGAVPAACFPVGGEIRRPTERILQEHVFFDPLVLDPKQMTLAPRGSHGPEVPIHVHDDRRNRPDVPEGTPVAVADLAESTLLVRHEPLVDSQPASSAVLLEHRSDVLPWQATACGNR